MFIILYFKYIVNSHHQDGDGNDHNSRHAFLCCDHDIFFRLCGYHKTEVKIGCSIFFGLIKNLLIKKDRIKVENKINTVKALK